MLPLFRTFLFPAISNSNIEDVQTCEVGPTLAQLSKCVDHGKHSYSKSENRGNNINDDRNQSKRSG
jgi:hypothetical protein